MTLPDLVHQNMARFSLASCVTEDSVESAALATPLDASPLPPPSNTFSIIDIVNNDPLPNLKSLNSIAAAYTTRRQTQTLPGTVPALIMMNNVPQQQPTMAYDYNDNNTNESNTTMIYNDNNITSTPIPASTVQPTLLKKTAKFWPRIKRIVMPSNDNINNESKIKQLFESMNMSTDNDKCEQKPLTKSNKRWLGRNKSRVGPQR